MVANECGVIPQMIPSRWNFQTFDDCTPSNLYILHIYISIEIMFFLINWEICSKYYIL